MKTIEPLENALDAVVDAPPSKAHTLRAIFFSALAKGRSAIANPLLGEDQMVAIEALRKFGAVFKIGENEIEVRGTAGELEAPEMAFAENSGVSMRFLCAIAGLAGNGGEKIVIDGSDRMRQRPVGDLLQALGKLGCGARSIRQNGCPPVEVIGKSLRGGTSAIDCSKSSQFASALLCSLPLAKKDSKLTITGSLPSRPYVGITLEMVRKFGGRIRRGENGRDFSIDGGQSYSGCDFAIEGDFSSAAFLFQAAAITGGKICVNGLKRDSLQADAEMLGFLQEMGCGVRRGENEVAIAGPRSLSPLHADLSDCPDCAMAVGVACAFAEGKSRLEGLVNLKLKESDRLSSLKEGLGSMGVKAAVSTQGDAIEIHGNPGAIHGARIDPQNDHRIAMAFAIAGLRVQGMVIENPECVKKSFPDFFGQLQELNENRKPRKLQN